MNKKTLIGSILATLIIVLAGFTSVVSANSDESSIAHSRLLRLPDAIKIIKERSMEIPGDLIYLILQIMVWILYTFAYLLRTPI